MPYLLENEDGNLLYNETNEVLSEGHLNSAFYFAGNDTKYIDIPSYAAIDFDYTDPFSIHIIFSITAYSTSSVVILDKRELNAGSLMVAEGYGFGYFGKQPYFVLGGNATLGAVAQFNYFFLEFQLELNTRYHVVINKTAAYNTPLAYSAFIGAHTVIPTFRQVNIVSYSQIGFTQSIKQALPLRIGATQGTDPHSNLNGHVYKLAIHNTTFTEGEAEESFILEGQTPAAKLASRVLYLPFKEKSGTVIDNENGTDGVVTGFTSPETSLGSSNRFKNPYSLLPILV